MTKNSYEEKRRHPRSQNRLLVQLQGSDFHIYTNATNICAGGAFINTLYLLNEGTVVTLKIDNPDSQETLDIRGKILRQVVDSDSVPTMDHIGMAVEFTDLTDEHEQALHAIVQSN